MLLRRAGALCCGLTVASWFFSWPAIHPLAAQSREPRGLAPGTLVRVTTLDGRETRGRVVRLEPELLRLSHADGSQSTVTRSDVRSIEASRSRVGSYAKRGALVGAVGGGIMGGLFLSDFCSGSTTCTTSTDLYIVGGGIVAGALAGTIIGTLLGWAVSDWVEVGPGAWEASRVPLQPAAASLVVSLRVPLAR